MRKTMKKFTAAALCALLAVSAAGCGGDGTSAAEKTEAAVTEAVSGEAKEAEETEAPKADAGEAGESYKIGVLQFVQHAALDKCNEGFAEALAASGLSVTVDQQNASGETASCTTIAQKLVNDGSDLIFTIATPAAQACAAETSEIPIVLTAVTDPAASGLLESNDAPGGNVTGSSDLTPVADQIGLIPELFPDARKVGVLYCSAESNSEIQAGLAHEACEALGLSYEDFTVSTSNDIQTVVESMVGNVDVIYIPTDNVLAAGMATVSMIANENGLPTIVGEEGMCDAGGLATCSIDYKELGKIAGEMAIRILTEGADPAEMPVEYYPSDKLKLVINEETAELLDVDTSVIEE